MSDRRKIISITSKPDFQQRLEVPTSYDSRSGSNTSNNPAEKRDSGFFQKDKHGGGPLSSSGTEASGNKADGELTPPKVVEADIKRIEEEL